MSQGVLNLREKLHDLPKHSKNILTKFDPNKSCVPEDHINNFYLSTRVLNVDHTYVVIDFSLTFFFKIKRLLGITVYQLGPLGSRMISKGNSLVNLANKKIPPPF
jgi:hypothetical protein